MKTLRLSRGFEAKVDDAVFRWASQFRWSVSPAKHTYYAYRKRERKNVYLHREILGNPEGREVDHVDGDGLNNQRENLRVVTHAGNAMARQSHRSGKTSVFRGVRFHQPSRKWTAQIKVDGANRWLGGFDREEEAARRYDEAALHYFGSLASPNFK